MRLKDFPAVPIAEAFGRRGYGIAHEKDNTFLILDKAKVVGRFTTFDVGEHWVGDAEPADLAVKAVTAIMEARSILPLGDAAPKKPAAKTA